MPPRTDQNQPFWESGGGTPSVTPTTSPALTPPVTMIQNGHLFQQITDPLTGEQQWVDLGVAPKDGAGSGSYNNPAMQASIAALSGFLQAQSLADARRMAASEQFERMGAFALPKGSKTAPGYEQGGAGQQLAAMQGRKTYTPPPIQTQTVNPAQLQQPGAVPPEIMEMINAIIGSAGKGFQS